MNWLLILATVVMLVGNVAWGWGIPVILALLPILLPLALALLFVGVPSLVAAVVFARSNRRL